MFNRTYVISQPQPQEYEGLGRIGGSIGKWIDKGADAVRRAAKTITQPKRWAKGVKRYGYYATTLGYSEILKRRARNFNIETGVKVQGMANTGASPEEIAAFQEQRNTQAMHKRKQLRRTARGGVLVAAAIAAAATAPAWVPTVTSALTPVAGGGSLLTTAAETLLPIAAPLAAQQLMGGGEAEGQIPPGGFPDSPIGTPGTPGYDSQGNPLSGKPRTAAFRGLGKKDFMIIGGVSLVAFYLLLR